MHEQQGYQQSSEDYDRHPDRNRRIGGRSSPHDLERPGPDREGCRSQLLGAARLRLCWWHRIPVRHEGRQEERQQLKKRGAPIAGALS